MDKIDLEVLPKKSVRAFSYLGAPIFIVVGIFIMSDSSIAESGVINLLMTLAGCLTIVLSLLWIPHTYRFRINFGPDSVTQTGLLSKEIPYSNIEKLIVRKGFIEICGKNTFRRISIGDLYMNFNAAIDLLSSKIKEAEDVTFAGQKKYIDKYFHSLDT